MYYLNNLLPDLAPVNSPGGIHRLLVSEPPSSYTLPEPDAYARRLAEEAEAFLRFARARNPRMKAETLVRKSLQSLAFSLRHRCNSFCAPSKAVGTGNTDAQKVLGRLAKERVGFGALLDVEEIRDGKRIRLVLSYDGATVGEVQSKWIPVVRPLRRWGTEVRIVRVSGLEHEGYRLGLNICFTHLAGSIQALERALGADLGGDGYGGDGDN